ncbi:MAG: asparagine synthase [Nanoarchaeota archaeon]|nr:asparagine synthase [Nanoarchaeota archaeon]
MQELLNALKDAIKKEIGDAKQVGLFFSGGLDSSIVGKLIKDMGIDVIPITVGEQRSEDVITAKEIAKLIFKKHVIVNTNKDIIKEIIPKVIKITGEKDAITVSVGCVIYLAAKYASKLGLKKIFTGAGSDELFAGYKSHEEALEKGWDEVQDECKRRIEGIKKDIQRDEKICNHFGLKVETPFLDDKVIEIALKIPPQEKISKDEKKILLRKLAKEIGLPSIVYLRKKKAAQYGTKVQKMIKKIAKEEGYATIADYLNNVYKKQKIL